MFCERNTIFCVFKDIHEGVLIDQLHPQCGWADAVLINPAALTLYSYALRETLAAIRPQTYEAHLSDIMAREPGPAISVVRDACVGVFGRTESNHIST